ncbi:putative nuclease HARBI1 [Cydia pomonella]|uniref:putative nuclease HARBI1 n=1 Tax=Cydia pomonella TaxID=82600 RepID=UPI002ADE3FD6|nr:putative nuclease HARBI1 [Cydia pomonella]
MDDAVAIIGLLCILQKKRQRRKRMWCKHWLLQRKQYTHNNLLKEIRITPKDYRNYLRMDEETYLLLLDLVTPRIMKQDTVMRSAISPHERLTATLRFLATGRSYEDLKFSTIISPQSLSSIIPETCEAIYSVLHKDYLKFPRSQEEWKRIAALFEQRWNFPHLLGAMDGKHVTINPPRGSGSTYFNYKKKHSMVLMAIVDAQYQFILCDFGTNGRISDGGVLQNTTFFQKLQENDLNIPAEEIVTNSSKSLPYVFVADDAFPLRTDMMKPFRQAELDTREKKIYNYRVSRARRIVENCFGILATRFRIFHTDINVHPSRIESIVMACCALHNFLIKMLPNSYISPECFDREQTDIGHVTPGYDTNHSTMEPLQQRNIGNTARTPKMIRQEFMNYFNNEGQVPWQNNFI